MRESERRYLDAVFGGDYHANKRKKEYAHIDTMANNASGIKRVQDQKKRDHERTVNSVLKESVLDLKRRGKISGEQATKMINAI